MTPLRVLIVDDEPPARRRLRRLLGDQANIAVVGEAADAATALGLVRSLRPHVVLLDIQMPEMSGLDLATEFGRPKPHVVFVTAHDAHAIRAFELRALDYLLKPVSRARLIDALSRVRRSDAPATRLTAWAGSHLDVVDVADIDWIEAADNYVVLHHRRSGTPAAPRTLLLRETMAHLAHRLDRTRFVRIHRSAIVQIDRIERLEPARHGDWNVILKDGLRLRLSRTYRARAMFRLRQRPF